MTSIPSFYPLTGGLDQETAAIAVPPGRAIAVSNHEAVSKGYQRTQGYERFDGQPSPAAAQFWVGEYIEGAAELTVGATITGATSGATGRIIASTLVSGTIVGGDAAGLLVIDNLTGIFTAAEDINISGSPVAVIDVPPALADKNDSASHKTWWKAAVANRRNVIQKPAGSGAVRGIFYYNGKHYAIRDNAGGTAAVIFEASASGWDPVDLGHSVKFSNGGTIEIEPGDVITGSVSGATATVRYIAIDSDTYWEDGNASGTMILDDVSGTFEAETVDVGSDQFLADIDGAPAAVTLPPGGRYEVIAHNFYGSTGTERIYAASGVGQAFEFDGSSLVFIETGMPDDRPFLIAAHKKHLFLGFPKGSVQFSGLGEPRSFSALLGAAEIGMGKELTNLIPNTAATLLITTDNSVAVISGNDSSDFNLDTISDEAGARRFTAQRIGNVLYMDERGIRSVAATQSYGNFKLGTYTSLIQNTLETKRNLGVSPVGSVVVKGKDQYLIFFDDGTGISIYMGRKQPEPMLFEYPFIVSSMWISEVDGKERLFIGAQDGYVYEMNVGTSFDGAEIEAFLQLPFGHQGSPRLLKRYHKAIIEAICGPDVSLSVAAEFGYGSGYQPYAHGAVFQIEGSGGIWGVSNWAEFYWSSPTVARAEAYLEGADENVSLIIISKSDEFESYVLQGVTIFYSGRGVKR